MADAKNADTEKRSLARRAVWGALAVVALLLVIAVAAKLRLAVWSWGKPQPSDFPGYFSYHPDEIFLLLPSFGFAEGDWDPHFFNYGTLYIYMVGVSAIWLGAVPDQSVFPFPEYLWQLYDVGRLVTLAMGLLTIVALYLALRREARATAVLAAVLLGLCPLHIVNSGYATVDVPATFWIVVAFWLALWGIERPGHGRGFLAGLTVGLAAATKYSAILFLVPVLLTPLLARPNAWRWSPFVGGILGAAFGFTLGCPFFLWPREFVHGVMAEARHAGTGGTFAFADTGSGWAYHLVHGLPVGLGYPLLAGAALGAIGAVRLPSRAARLSLAAVVFYLLAIGFGEERFIRYLVPLTPFLCVLAATGVRWLWGLSTRAVARALALSTGLALVVLTGLYAHDQSRRFLGSDPRDEAYSRTFALAPRTGLIQAPWFFHPPVSPYNAGPFSKPWFERWNQETGNRVIITGWEAQKLLAERPDVFFLSDLESQDLIRLRDQAAVSLVGALNQWYEKKTLFARPPPRFPWLAPPRAWAPPDWLYPDPHITMYYRPRPKDQ